jgi:hypothetical protein
MHRSLHVQMRANFGQRSGEFRPLIATVGEQLLKKGKHPKQGRHDENGTGHTMAFCNLPRMEVSSGHRGPTDHQENLGRGSKSDDVLSAL